jgi:uncharacterized membrane protein YphA (DoxX/SURF4 family)
MLGLGLVLMRLVLATILVAHGSHMLFGAFATDGAGPGGLTHTTAYFAGLGLTPALVFALLAGGARFLGGLLIGLGYFTRLVSGALVIVDGLEIWKDSARWGFFLNWAGDPTRGHGMEYALMLAGALACLIFAGAGEWSLDGWRAGTAQARAAGRARLHRG